MIKKLLTYIFSLILFFTFALPANAQTFGVPLTYSGFGLPYGTWYQGVYHNGIDFAADCGTPIYASNYGTITYAGWDWTGYGYRVDITNGDDVQLYAHLQYIDVWSGTVKKGQYIGDVGNTGWSEGCHLHFELWWKGMSVNPRVTLGI